MLFCSMYGVMVSARRSSFLSDVVPGHFTFDFDNSGCDVDHDNSDVGFFVGMRCRENTLINFNICNSID